MPEKIYITFGACTLLAIALFVLWAMMSRTASLKRLLRYLERRNWEYQHEKRDWDFSDIWVVGKYRVIYRTQLKQGHFVEVRSTDGLYQRYAIDFDSLGAYTPYAFDPLGAYVPYAPKGPVQLKHAQIYERIFRLVTEKIIVAKSKK